MTKTSNFGLNKPDYKDVADIADLNKNADIIDGELEDRLSKSEGGTVEGDVSFKGTVEAKTIKGSSVNITALDEEGDQGEMVLSGNVNINNGILNKNKQGLWDLISCGLCFFNL